MRKRTHESVRDEQRQTIDERQNKQQISDWFKVGFRLITPVRKNNHQPVHCQKSHTDRSNKYAA